MRVAVVAFLVGCALSARVRAQENPEPNALPEPDVGAVPADGGGPPDAGAPSEADAGLPIPPGPSPLSAPLGPVPPAPPVKSPKHAADESQKSEVSGEEEEALEEVAPRPSAKGDPFGDEPEGVPKTKGFSFRFLLQTRWTRVFDDASTKDAQSNDGFALNRVFLRGTVHPYKWLSAKLLVDFAELAYSNPQQALKLAYGEIKPWKRLELTVGLFKRTYSLLELLPIAEYEFADTGPTDNLIKDCQFGGRDVGAMIRGDPLPKRAGCTSTWARSAAPARGPGGFRGPPATPTPDPISPRRRCCSRRACSRAPSSTSRWASTAPGARPGPPTSPTCRRRAS